MARKQTRDTAKYQLRQGRKVVHEGKTSQSLEEREAQHQKQHPGSKISQVGRRTTDKAASEWEKSRPRPELVRKPTNRPK